MRGSVPLAISSAALSSDRVVPMTRQSSERRRVRGASLTNAIYLERRLELIGEGHRFFDLVRTGKAVQEINGFQAGKHELFPIPAIEIQLAGNVWAQNPGY